MHWNMESPLAVMPVLVGPLQVLLALLPAVLVAFGGALLALFKPSGMRKIVGFLWHQKIFSICLLLLGLAIWQGYPRKLWSGLRNALGLRAAPVTESARAGEWPTSRGGPHRTGYAGGDEPTAAGSHWAWNDHKTVFSSPTVAGDRVYFTTVTGIGPFTPTGQGAVVCVDVASGREQWRYEGDDGDLRGTFSSPAVGEGRIVVGEGLHQTSDARVTCLDLSGRKIWDYRTASHVESTPCIHAGRVYVACAGDGFYCFDLAPDAEGKPNVIWHLTGDRYADCESSPVTDGQTVWFGLGEEGNAVVAVNAADGSERWCVTTPFPVFAAPTFVQDDEREGHGRIFIGMGNGNFMFSADELRAARVESMRDEGKSADEIAADEKALATAGAVWCLDAATGNIEWRHDLPDTVLDSIAYQPPSGSGPGRLFFGSRDGFAYSLGADGTPFAKWNAGSPILASPALGRQHVYFATKTGRLFALKTDTLQPVWDMTVQQTGTLTSSPAIADGRLFIGTEDQGLRCVGTNEPPMPPVVAVAERGGPVDDVALPDEAEVAWTTHRLPDEQLDRQAEQDAKITNVWYAGISRGATSLPIVLGDSLYCFESVTYQDTGVQDLVRIELPRGREDVPRLVWRVKHVMHDAIAAADDTIVVQQSGWNRGRSPLTAFDAATGEVRWQRDSGDSRSKALRNDYELKKPPLSVDDVDERRARFGLDAERVWFWDGPQGLSCISLQEGKLVWTVKELAGNDLTGGPVVVGDVLLVCVGNQLHALDASTSARLWRTSLSTLSARSPLVCGSTVVMLAIDGSLSGLDIRDGSALWRFAPETSAAKTPTLPIQLGDCGSGRCAVSYGDRIILLNALSGDVLFERKRSGSVSASLQWTSLRRGDDLLLIEGTRLAWWRPGEDETRTFFELTGESEIPPWSRDAFYRPTVSFDGQALVTVRGRGIVCLRGVMP
ncbi:MAG: PQQ-binding-like beta-propeller repeat protein [Planctomycetaceae bacterium]|nr:PQQ-binding-like beta-propeller repeat protein [Planctomycetaceae bacterium]